MQTYEFNVGCDLNNCIGENQIKKRNENAETSARLITPPG